MFTSQANVSSINQGMGIKIYRLTSVGIELMTLTLGLLLNLFLIIALIKDPLKTFKTPSSSFIFNIAFVDILVCVFWIIETIFNLTSTVYRVNKKIVEVLYYVLIASIGISPVLYLSLSIERFCSVAFPLWHRVHITTRVCRYWLCVIWTIHIIFEILVSCLVPPEMDYEHRIAKGFEYGIITLLRVGFPFLFTQVFYVATYFSLKKQGEMFLKRLNISDDAIVSGRILKIRLLREKNFLCTIAVVCFILNFTFLPSILFRFFYFQLGQSHSIDPNIEQFILISFSILLSFNFAINPIVYVWRLPKYRKTFKLLYCKFS